MSLDTFVGLLGIVLLLLVFQVNERRKILWIQVISNLVWTLYYVLGSMYTAAGLILLGAVRGYVFERYRHHRWVYGAIIGLFTIATILTWKNWTSLLALLGMTAITTAMWQESPRRIRVLSPTTTPFWLSYNFLNHSYLGMVGDTITFLSIVIGIYRFDIRPYLETRMNQRKLTEVVETQILG